VADVVARSAPVVPIDEPPPADAVLSAEEPLSIGAPLSGDELASASASAGEVLSAGEPPLPEPTGDAAPAEVVSGEAPAAEAVAGDADVAIDDSPIVSEGLIDVVANSDSGAAEPVVTTLDDRSDSLTSDSGFSLGNLDSDQLRALEESDAVIVVKKKPQ
jgi:hypothetical protein